VLDSLREVMRYRSLLRDLVARDLKVRYKRSALGILWTMLNPLLLMVIFTIVFAHIQNANNMRMRQIDERAHFLHEAS